MLNRLNSVQVIYSLTNWLQSNTVNYVYIIRSILRVNHSSYCYLSCILGWRPFITSIL